MKKQNLQQALNETERVISECENFLPKEYIGKLPFLIPLGTIQFVPKDVIENFIVREIDVRTPIMTQLMDLPMSKGVHIVCPDQWNDDYRNDFLVRVHKAYMSLCQSRITYGSSFLRWAYNAMDNASVMQSKATPICKERKRDEQDVAIIVGMGPSMQKTLDSVNLVKHNYHIGIFSCWHAAETVNKKIHPDYICHCDSESLEEARHTGPMPWAYPITTTLIAAPQVTPTFLQNLGSRKMLGYFGQDFQLNGALAKYHGVADHHAIHCTVITMMIHSAIYMGYKKIALVGVDNGWTNSKQPYENAIPSTIKKVKNSHGKDIYTYPTFEVAADGLAEIAALNKGVKIYQTSQHALDVKFIEYKPLKEVLENGKDDDGSSKSSPTKHGPKIRKNSSKRS